MFVPLKADFPYVQYLPFDEKLEFKEEGDWKPSDYGSQEGRLEDKKVRDSDFKYAVLPYANPNLKNTNALGKWRIIRYKDGKFLAHEDQKHESGHVGTEILIFPKKVSPHSEGALRIYNPKSDKEWIEVVAQEHVFVYVFIPLGYRHEITEVKGVRIVATRMVLRQIANPMPAPQMIIPKLLD